MTQPRFYYDFRAPDAWLAAERVVHVLDTVPEFVPVDLRGLTADGMAHEVDAAALVERASAYGLLSPRLPQPFPPADSSFALLAATYAKQIGKGVAFSHALFRQAYAAGRDLGERDTVFLAGAAAEIHPAALAKGAELRGTAERLRAATAAAADAGVLGVPAVVIGDDVFHGDAELERAAAALAMAG